jgi:hypothetical protein
MNVQEKGVSKYKDIGYDRQEKTVVKCKEKVDDSAYG